MSFNLSKPNRTINAAVVVLDSITEFLDVAPMDLISGLSKEFIEFMPASELHKSQALDINVLWVNEKGDRARLTMGASVQCTHSFANCPPVDIVLMGAARVGYVPTEAELNFVRKVHEQCSAFIMVCGGFIPALEAGILKGKTATAPRGYIPRMREEHPEVNWIEKRWAHDGKLWSSGVLLNGLDTVVAFAKETWDNELVDFMIKLGDWPVRSADY